MSTVSDIYCLPGRRTDTFVQRVHRILNSLRRWDANLQEHLAFRWEDSNRHVASLHLCYNQCIIHTTRPILLRIFQTQFHRGASCISEQKQFIFSPTTTALANSCVNAARTSNKILSKLFIDGTLATLGYWDAHYLFSSTMILIMSAVMDPNVAVSDAVQTAFNLLHSMRDGGNVPASDYCNCLALIQTNLIELREGTGRENDAAHSDQDRHPAGNNWPLENTGSGGFESQGFEDLDALANPYIDDFLAEKVFAWPSMSLPDGSNLQQLANEISESFGFPELN